MQLRWTEAAASDLDHITDYLTEHTPATAGELVGSIVVAAESLKRFPNRGRPGRRPGTRELVLSPLPYLIIYQVREHALYIVRILHGAQRWP